MHFAVLVYSVIPLLLSSVPFLCECLSCDLLWIVGFVPESWSLALGHAFLHWFSEFNEIYLSIIITLSSETPLDTNEFVDLFHLFHLYMNELNWHFKLWLLVIM